MNDKKAKNSPKLLGICLLCCFPMVLKLYYPLTAGEISVCYQFGFSLDLSSLLSWWGTQLHAAKKSKEWWIGKPGPTPWLCAILALIVSQEWDCGIHAGNHLGYRNSPVLIPSFLFFFLPCKFQSFGCKFMRRKMKHEVKICWLV